jgi:hypothetical protein
MELLSDDPTYLAGALGFLAVAMLITLRVTQQGRYLILALTALALMIAVLVVEHLWVTDNERIEQVVYDLRDAVLASDVERVLTFLTPSVQFVRQGDTSSGEETRAFIRSILPHAKFDFLRISRLRAEAYRRSRRGTAQFRVITSGSLETRSTTLNFAATNSDWSLGFEETTPQVWKVNRISPTRAPGEMPVPGPPAPEPRRRRSRFSRQASPEENGSRSPSAPNPEPPSAPFPIGSAKRG